MSNSSLASITKVSPYKSERTYRNGSSTGKISKITIHHMAGKMSASGCLDWFSSSQCKASSNYVIGYDGTIGLSVPEAYRSWCSSNGDNDNIAITIECSNTGSNDSNWPVSDTVLEKCIILCWDICKRNGITALNYTGKTDGNLTRHDMFISKVCPGPYLGSKFPYIVEQVNKRLNDPYYRPLCVYGDKNDYVKELQANLLEQGYSLGGYNADGSYGYYTRAAVEQFQKDHGITADGMCGQLTWPALLKKESKIEQTENIVNVEIKEETTMSKCTAAQAVAAMEYWIGYKEKASSSYATTRDKSAFEKNAGSNNFTFAGYLCGVQGQAWCAAQVTLAIYEACGNSKELAKEAMYGVWPYVSCEQVWNAAPDSKKFWSYYQRWTLGKGERTTYVPKVGDIIIFTNDGTTRSHTGMVYKVDSKYVYTIEGNSGNMCRTRSYLLTSSYIYGWVRPNYSTSTSTDVSTPTTSQQYGEVCCTDPELHILSKGVAGSEVEVLQILLNGRANAGLEVDGDFGTKTETAVINFQSIKGLEQTGIVEAKTWKALLS